MLRAQSHLLARLCFFIAAYSIISLECFAQTPANSCVEIGRVPVAADSLYTDLFDPALRSSFLARVGGQFRVYRVEKVQGAYSVVEGAAVPASMGQDLVSTGFLGSQVFVARSIFQQAGPGGFQSPSEFTEIPAYSLTDGSQNPSLSFVDPSRSNMAPLNYSPFWSKNAPYSSWEGRACPGPTEGQLGRLVTAISGDSLVVANNFEFSGEYFDVPYSCGQQVHERNPDGSTKMRVARNNSDPAQPFFCDLVHPRPGVLGCQKVGTYESPSCVEITPTPTPTPTGTPVNPAATPTPQPQPPAACAVRMEPDPIENVPGQAQEFCATCPYYWWAMDPAFSIYTRNSGGAMVKSSSFRFPALFGNENIEIPVPESEFVLGRILQLRPNSAAHGFAAAVELAAPQYPELTNSGGVYFFNAGGQFTGFTSAFFENGRTGSTLSAVGMYEGRAVYASGSPENATFHPDLSEFPAEWTQHFKPEAGHVLFTKDDGELLSIQFGLAAGERFGSSIAGLGDVSADGVPDALIGAAGGDYAVISSGGGEDPGTILRLDGAAGSGFGSMVGTLSSQTSGMPDVAIIGSDSELILYDISTCIASAATSSYYRALTLDEAAAAVGALGAVAVPGLASQAAGAFDALVEFNSRLRNLLFLLRTHAVIPDAIEKATELEIESGGLNSALQTYNTETLEFEAANDRAQNLTSKVKRLQKKRKKAGGFLSTPDKKKLKKFRNAVKVLSQEQEVRILTRDVASTSAQVAKQNLREELLELVDQGQN